MDWLRQIWEKHPWKINFVLFCVVIATPFLMSLSHKVTNEYNELIKVRVLKRHDTNRANGIIGYFDIKILKGREEGKETVAEMGLDYSYINLQEDQLIGKEYWMTGTKLSKSDEMTGNGGYVFIANEQYSIHEVKSNPIFWPSQAQIYRGLWNGPLILPGELIKFAGDVIDNPKDPDLWEVGVAWVFYYLLVGGFIFVCLRNLRKPKVMMLATLAYLLVVYISAIPLL